MEADLAKYRERFHSLYTALAEAGKKKQDGYLYSE